MTRRNLLAGAGLVQLEKRPASRPAEDWLAARLEGR